MIVQPDNMAGKNAFIHWTVPNPKSAPATIKQNTPERNGNCSELLRSTDEWIIAQQTLVSSSEVVAKLAFYFNAIYPTMT
jgi:hypothetical protein